MKNRRVLLVLLWVLAVYGTIFACGPQQLPGPGRPLFDWGMLEDPAYVEILRSDFLDNGSVNFDFNAYTRTMDSFVSEWLVFLGLSDQASNREAVLAMLEAEEPAVVLTEDLWPLLPAATKKNREIAQYLAILANDEVTVATAKSALEAFTTRFLKQRMALILLRTQVLAKDYSGAEQSYKTWFASATDSILRGRARAWMARLLLDQGKRQEALAAYVRLFDQYPDSADEHLASVYMIDPTVSEWDEMIASLPAGHARTMAWFVRAQLDPHKMTSRYMAAIYAEEPGSAHLNKLLVQAMREIGWQEQGLLYANAGLGPFIFSDENSESMEVQIPAQKKAELLAFCQRVVQNGSVKDLGFFVAAGTQLLIMQGDVKAAQSFIEGAWAKEGQFKPAGRAVASFHRWLAAQANAADDTTRERLFSQAMVGMEAMRSNGDLDYFTQEAYVFLAMKYLKEQRVAEAAVAFKASGYAGGDALIIDVYAEISDLQSLLKLDAKTAKAEAKALLAKFPVDTDQINYAIATRMLRDGNFNAAIQGYAKVSDAFWQSQNGKQYYDFWEEEEMGRVRFSTDNPYTVERRYKSLSKKDLAVELARLEKAQDYATLGWIFTSTALIGYNDNLWEGSMVALASDWQIQAWPYVVQGAPERMKAKKQLFLERYDSMAIGGAYLWKAQAKTQNVELRSTLAIGALEAYQSSSYTSTLGETDRSRDFAKLLQGFKLVPKSRFLENYISNCPGIKAYR